MNKRLKRIFKKKFDVLPEQGTGNIRKVFIAATQNFLKPEKVVHSPRSADEVFNTDLYNIPHSPYATLMKLTYVLWVTSRCKNPKKRKIHRKAYLRGIRKKFENRKYL